MIYNGNYEEFLNELIKFKDEKFKDEKYLERHKKIISIDLEEIIGIKIPVLKKIAKEIAKGDFEKFLKEKRNNIYEEKLIRGLVIGFVKKDYEQLEKYIKDFFENDVDSWSVCDTSVANLKIVKKNREKYFKLMSEYLDSKNPWKIRVALVSFIAYYNDKEYIDKLIEISKKVKNDHYYVKMALAWLISQMFVKNREKTLKFLTEEKDLLDPWTYNKSLQKIRESLQVSKKDKILMKKLKKNVSKP